MCCAAGPVFSVGNTLKMKLEGLGTYMLQNLDSFLREIIEASSQSFRGCVSVPVGQLGKMFLALPRRHFGSIVVIFASIKCKI